MLWTYCIPCERHHEVIQHAPPGVMGGAKCRCKGECLKADETPDLPGLDVERDLRAILNQEPRERTTDEMLAHKIRQVLPTWPDDVRERALEIVADLEKAGHGCVLLEDPPTTMNLYRPYG